MDRVGYIRFSTSDQNGDAQRDALKAAGCERIFEDAGVSGKLATRPGLDGCLAYLREGDTLVVTKLDRLGRSLPHLIETVNTLGDRKINVQCLDRGEIDTTTAAGELIFNIFASLAQWERRLISERTKEGLAAARARGRKGGRKPALGPAQATAAREMYDAKDEDGKRKYTVEQIAALFKVSRPAVYYALEHTPGDRPASEAGQEKTG